MESCLLCLELNRDILEVIKVQSKLWRELEIQKTIEKHFWLLNNIQPSSWICTPCWQAVEHFHKFYSRVEEAHSNFGKIKVEDEQLALCFQEPEIQIDQDLNIDLAEPEIHTNETAVNEKNSLTLLLNEQDLDDTPFKRLKLQSHLETEDPLEKSHKCRRKRNSKTESKSTERLKRDDPKVKKQLECFQDKDLKSISDNEVSNDTNQADKDSTETTPNQRRRVNGKHHPNRKDNDKFISAHFKDMNCDLCQVPFKDFPEMQKHFADNHNQRGYVICCKRKFSDRTRLVDHLHCHLNPDHFKCRECGKTMSDRIKFDKHMLLVHRANDVVKKHYCDICGKSFREAYVLRTHKLIHLPEKEKKFHCSDCGKNYGSAYLLNQHRQVVHLKRFVKVCYICGKEINSSAEFKVHMNKHEGIPLPTINCDVCGLRLSSERGLKVHKASQHPIGGKQDHPCPLCEKISPTARALKKHVITMHEKGYDHKCILCDKAFRRADKLKEHIATHTGSPLYSCPWCSMTFNSNGNMHSHRQNKHPKEYLEYKLQKYNFV